MINNRKSAMERHSKLKSFRKNLLACSLMVLPSVGAISQANAQDGSEDRASGSLLLDQIVVTAQKREENSQDVGIAITAFSGEQIDKLGVENSIEISKFTPGVSLSGSFAGQQQQFSIRGVTQNDFNDHVEAPNAVYIDEGYVAMQQGQIFATFDIDRVEVLKGPQGTLFGRNATGGLVHFITRKPTDEFEGFLDATYGSYDHVRLEGAISGPITNTVRARLSGMFNRHDGYLENAYPDETFVPAALVSGLENGIVAQPSGAGADLGGDSTWALRGQLAADFGDNSELNISTFWTKTETSVGPYQSSPTVAIFDAAGGHINTIYAGPGETREAIGPGGVALNGPFDLDADTARPVAGGDWFGYIDPDGNDFLTSSNFAFDDLGDFETYGATANFKTEFENVTFTSVTDFKHHEKFQALDLEAAPVDQFFWFGQAEIDSFTQEFRLNGQGERYRWVAGFFYLNIEAQSIQGFGAIDSSIFASGPGTGFDQPRISDLDTESYSLFGQFEYDLTDNVTFIGGLRGTIERKEYDFEVRTTPNVTPLAWDFDNPFSIDVAFEDQTQDEFLTAKAQFDWRPTDDVLLYASFNRGVKAGSFNSGGAGTLAAEIPYDKEILNAYEVGFKSDLANGLLRFNGAVYYYDYKDYQAARWTGLSNIIQNNDSTVYGAEAEIITSPFENFDLMVSAGYVDAEVKGVNIAGTLHDVRPTFSPEWTASGLARYTVPDVAGGDVALQASISYQSAIFHNLTNFDATRFDGWKVVDLKLGWESQNADWALDVFAKNVFDERYNVIGFDLSQLCGCNEEAQGKPRWWGVSVRKSF